MRVLTNPSGWFTLEVPDGWESETEDSVTTLRGPGHVGVLYLSGARHAGGKQESFGGADFLSRFLGSLGMAVPENAIQSFESQGCRIYAFAREAGGVHWSYWSVTDDETALLISYTCRSVDLAVEAPQVDCMVRSVRLYHSARAH
jgi:hypothetical protein